MTHALVLAIAGAISGYATFDRPFFSSSHAPAVTAAASNEGVEVGGVSLGRDSVIIKPLAIPIAPLVSHAPIVHVVAQEDTLESIGRQFNPPWRYIVWSNPGLRMPLKVGQPLKLAPVPGVVVVVRRGTRLRASPLLTARRSARCSASMESGARSSCPARRL